MPFLRVYFTLLFSRAVWGHGMVLFLCGLHVLCWATGDTEWWRLPLGFMMIFLVVAVFVLVGTAGGYLAHRENERAQV